MAKMVSLKATDFKAAGTKVGQIQKSMEGFASISAQLAALAEKVENPRLAKSITTQQNKIDKGIERVEGLIGVLVEKMTSEDAPAAAPAKAPARGGKAKASTKAPARGKAPAKAKAPARGKAAATKGGKAAATKTTAKTPRGKAAATKTTAKTKAPARGKAPAKAKAPARGKAKAAATKAPARGRRSKAAASDEFDFES